LTSTAKFKSLNRENIKYLGNEESEGIQHPQMKERLKKEYTRRLRMILKSELIVNNKIIAIGELAVPVLTLRLLMSYVYIYIYIYIYMEHPFLMFLDHTTQHSR